MRTAFLPAALAIGLLSVGAAAALAASAEEEQAFLDTYRTAFDNQDAATLAGLLFSDGAIPEAVGFYEMLMTADFGQTITSIALDDLDAEDLERIDETMPTPDGQMAKLAPRPYKKLVIVIDSSDDSGAGTSTSRTYVAEHDGRLGISMPVPAN